MRGKVILTVIIGLFSIVITVQGVTVDGYCYLENQSNHSGSKVLFLSDSPPEITDSVFTDSIGYYQIDLTIGVYHIYFQHDAFITDSIIDQSIYSPITLPYTTLYNMPVGIHISGNISGILDDTTYIAESNIYVQTGDSLIIMPGTTIYFFKRSAGEGQFIVSGYLYAVGTEQDSIKFLPISPVAYWVGLWFRESVPSIGSRLEYCYITGSHYAGLEIQECNPIISHCTITGNSYSRGGGIRVQDSNSCISFCTVTSCSAQYSGGGIDVRLGAEPLIENCVISNNYAPDGGGIHVRESSHPIILNCTISGNSNSALYYTELSGGTLEYCTISNNSNSGIYLDDYSNPIISKCQIYRNTYGGLDIRGCATPLIDSCEIYLNVWSGVRCSGESQPIIQHCVISENSSDEGGGLILNFSSPIILNCTLTRNTASTLGAAIACYLSSANIINTIVENSLVSSAVYFYNSTSISFQYCDFHSNEGGNFSGNSIPQALGEVVTVNANGDSCDVYANIYMDPMFVDPFVQDYRLQSGSPCIDAGDPTSPLDPDGTVADMGAFYYDQSTWVKDPPEIAHPFEYRLLSAYPNPFNPTTTILFEVPVTGQVQVNVYDVLGREVATLVNGDVGAGQHTVVWDAESMPSGIYFMQMAAREFRQVKKVVLLK